MAALDVTYTYKSSTSEFIIKSSTPSSVRDTRAIITCGLDMYRAGNPVASAVDGAGLQTNMTYEEAYVLELSKETIALGADMYITQDTTDISREVQVIGTRIDLIPFTVMLGMMVIYGCIVLVILLQAVITVSRMSYVQLASAHLTDPLVTVHALYGPKDAIYTWQNKTLKKFGTESDRDRLNVGEFSDHSGRRRFAVQRSGVSFDIGSFGK
ncbi:hypothetical protein BDQ17DRAFT_614363 [Cyathus striatus]|nr:hypothetical protein BDQ17DRAFT_614363 [Cyathus striatus]